VERCEVCGFAWDAIDPVEVPTGVRQATSALADLLVDHGPRALERAEPARWSPVEYGCHVRDVLGNVRDRIVLALVEDDPTPHPMFGTARVDLGLYGRDVPEVTARDLVAAGDLSARTLECLPEGAGRRTLFYGWPRAATRPIDWVAAQALHECRHHLDDVRTDLAGDGR
jgi:S-DNA-T family DNA segregation ATPase FtsK/SpoIIIE